MNLFVVFFLLLTLNAPTSVCIMHILYTVLHTYPKAMAWRIFLTIRSFLSLRFFSLFKGDTVGRNKFDLGTGGGGKGGVGVGVGGGSVI